MGWEILSKRLLGASKYYNSAAYGKSIVNNIFKRTKVEKQA